MVLYCNDLDKEAAEIIARTFGVQAVKCCDPSILDQIKDKEGDLILVGGENANPIVKRLVEEGLIPPIASLGPNQCFIGRVIYGKARVWVLAGYEKEDTLFIAKLIEAKKNLPDIDLIEKIFGRNYLVFPRGREPYLVAVVPNVDVLGLLKKALELLEKIPDWLRPDFLKNHIETIKDILAHSEQKITQEATYVLYYKPSEVTAGIPIAVAAIIIVALAIAGVAVYKITEVWIWDRKQRIVELQTAVQFKQIEETAKIVSKLIEEGRYQEAVEVINTLNKSIAEVFQAQVGEPWWKWITETLKWVGISVIAGAAAYIIYKIWKK